MPGLSAEENVALPLLLRHVSHNEAEQRARAAFEDVGLVLARHPPAALSGDEQQRTAITRAAMGNPKLILAGEPTSNLDNEPGNTILDLLSKLPREREGGGHHRDA